MNFIYSEAKVVPIRMRDSVNSNLNWNSIMALTKDAVFEVGAENIPLPDSYTLPTTAIEQTDPTITAPIEYEMTGTSAVSTTPTLGLDALITAFETWLDATFIPTTLGIDVAGNTVTCVATISKIVVGDHPADIFENDATRKTVITFTASIEVS